MADVEELAEEKPARVSPGAEVYRLLLPIDISAEFSSRLSGLEILDRVPAIGSYWQFESVDGALFDFSRTLTNAWEKPPFSILLRLVSIRPARRTMAEAVIGTRYDLAKLRTKAFETAVTLLRKAMSNPFRPDGPLRDAAPDQGKMWPIPSILEGHGRRLFHRLMEKLLVEEWGIGLIDQSVGCLVSGEKMRSVNWIEHDQNANLADPHPWPGTDRILCEEFGVGQLGSSVPGKIMALEVDTDQRRITTKRLILGGSQHRSYPGATMNGSEVLLLPETPARGATMLYRLDNSGALESLCRIAPHLRVGDPTLFRHDGRWWVAFTDLDLGEHDNLCLMYADELTGPWQQHPGNPVKIDIRSARPAGPLFRTPSALIRPAQNCARSYGASIVLNEVDILTPERFEEHAIQHLQPAARGRYPHGLHTIADFNGALLVDGKRSVFRLGHVIDAVSRVLAKKWAAKIDAMETVG